MRVDHLVSASSRFRLSALLAGAAVIAASVLPALPASADDTPTPDPTVSSQPTTDPAPSDTSDPTPPSVVELNETPTPDPTPPSNVEPVTPDPTPTPDAMPPAETESYTGSLVTIADEAADGLRPYPLLSVDGLGYLRVDTAGLGGSAKLSGTVTLTLAVPDGLTLSDDAVTRFTQLAKAGASTPLVAVGYSTSISGRHTANAINQTPSVAAHHQVYVVLVSPNSLSQGSNQTATEAGQLVSYANSFWSGQSAGGQVINFDLAGTTTWYKSSYSCKTDSGSASLWNQAAAKAATQLGYAPGKNVHLLLLFPRTANCGNAIGLGTIGGSVNAGGLTWVLGGHSLAIREATAAHELGHNLSMGHADWLECNATNPQVGATHVIPETATKLSKISGCEINYYGDMSDVMGFGLDDDDFPFDGGSLSSPSAVRAGIWPGSAIAVAGDGITTKVLNSVSSHTGLRTVIVQDTDGTNYFVEFRNFTGDDAEAADYRCYPEPGITGGGACFGRTEGEVGVRILRIEPSGYQGLPGYDSFLIGYKTGVSATPNDVKWGTGQTYTTEAGTTIEVTAMTGTTATVKVTRPVLTPVADTVEIDTVIAAKNGIGRVGDTLNAFLSEDWKADLLSYQWKRNGFNVGSNSPSYTLTPSDLGANMTVTVTATVGGTSVSNASPSYGPIGAGTLFAANAGTTGITGSTQLGSTLSASSTWTVKDLNNPVASTTNYQWYREGVAIVGATNSSYQTDTADYGKKLTVKAVLSATGYSTFVSPASASFTPNVKGVIVNGASTPSITGPSGSMVLSASTATTDTIPAATSMSYQWLRAGVPVSGKTKSTYTLTSADFGKDISLTVTYKRTNFASLTRTAAVPASSVANVGNYSVEQTGGGTLTGSPIYTAGGTNVLTATIPTYRSALDFTSLTTTGTNPKIEWLRSGVVIASATNSTTYAPVAADKGKTIAVRFTMTAPGLLTSVITTPATPALGNTLLDNTGAALAVVFSGTPTPTKTVLTTLDALVVGPAPVASAYQWLRDGKSISGATKSTYTLTSSDRGHLISVRKTTTKKSVGSLSYTPSVRLSPGNDYSLTFASGHEPYLSAGEWQVGVQAGAYDTGFTDGSGNSITGQHIDYQWYVGSSAVKGNNSDQFQIPASAYGKKVTVRLTVTKPGLIPLVYNPVQPYTVGKGVTVGTPEVEVVPAGPGKVKAQLVAGTLVPSFPTPTFTYKWYRDAGTTAIGTSSNYTFVTADTGHKISVKVTMTRSNFTVPVTAVPQTSPVGYSILSDGSKPTIAGTAAIGQTLFATPPPLFEADGTTALGVTPTLTYSWYRSGTKISGQTGDHYVVTTSDKSKTISVSVTASYTGRQSYTSSKSLSTPSVVIGTIDPGTLQPSVQITTKVSGSPAVTTKTAAVVWDGTPAIPASAGFTYSYQWFREGVVAPISTASTYKLVAADTGKLVTVHVTLNKSGFTSYTALAAVPANQIITAPADPIVLQAGGSAVTTATIGDTLSAVAPLYYNQEDYPLAGSLPTEAHTYQWYCNDSPIPGATGYQYGVLGTDAGCAINVVITVNSTFHDDKIDVSDYVTIS